MVKQLILYTLELLDAGLLATKLTPIHGINAILAYL